MHTMSGHRGGPVPGAYIRPAEWPVFCSIPCVRTERTHPLQALTVLVIDENRIPASIIEGGLREAGHQNVTIVHEVAGIARRIAEINPDVIVIDLGNPNRDMLENMFQLSRAVRRPVAMFVDSSDPASIPAPLEAGVSA